MLELGSLEYTFSPWRQEWAKIFMKKGKFLRSVCNEFNFYENLNSEKIVMIISFYFINLSKLKYHNNKQIHIFTFLNFLKEIFCPQKIIIYHWNWRIEIQSFKKVSIFQNN